jgi:hypothetical protein
MNPLTWSKEHRLAVICFGSLGALLGIGLAWLDSPFHHVCRTTISGEFSNCSQIFMLWLRYPSQYWLSALVGAAILGLGYYSVRLAQGPAE